jgi:hypothetical protein
VVWFGYIFFIYTEEVPLSATILPATVIAGKGKEGGGERCQCIAGGHKEMSSVFAEQDALVYEPKCWGAGGGGGCGVSANEYSCTHGAK